MIVEKDGFKFFQGDVDQTGIVNSSAVPKHPKCL